MKMQTKNLKFRMPAEWEPHEGTWFSWPHYEKHWPGKLESIPLVYKKIVTEIAKSEKVFICVNGKEMEDSARALIGTQNRNIYFYKIETNASWIRDCGPIFVKNKTGKLNILDWIYNAWGEKWPFDLDDIVPQKIGKEINLPVVTPGIVLEGGSIDVNGKGSLLTTEQCLLNKNRNPDLSRREIEAHLSDFLGVTNVLWLKEGIVGDDTDGHIDDIARFVDSRTVVCAVEENTSDENYEALKNNFKLLEKMKDQEGGSLNVIPLPMPKPVVYEGTRLPASYANFYITNDSVLLPTFRNKNDDKAFKVLESVFKDRKIVGIDCWDLIWGFGAIHCSTQQQPSVSVVPK